MLVKRVYTEEGEIAGVDIVHIGRYQNFSERFVKKACAEGWMRKDGHYLVLKSNPEVFLRVVRSPGFYLVTDPHQRFETGDEARKHMEEAYKGKSIGTEDFPSGVQWSRKYECVNESYGVEMSPVEVKEAKRDWIQKFMSFLTGE